MRLLQRMKSERGWSMVEAQLAMVIMGILGTSVAPAVMDFTDEAYKIAAASNVRGAMPAVETYFMDNGTYWGLDLTLYDPRAHIQTDQSQNTPTSYCIFSTAGKFTFFQRGPGGEIVEDPTPGFSPCG